MSEQQSQTQTLPAVHVAAAVLYRGNRILLCRRGYGKFKDQWELPGGKVEAGESAQAACSREIAEELNLHISFEPEPWQRFVYPYPDFILQMDIFTAPLPADARPALRAHNAFALAGAEALPQFAWLKADRDLIPLLQDFVRTLPVAEDKPEEA